ncbi:hypothetical protein R1flu_000559 [Riccia fluitans]|uniref:Uncharacterized protein n=1 Tax=Riccia fluitans TaxID=41844 RepID=A0ABD1Y0S5_9MARC
MVATNKNRKEIVERLSAYLEFLLEMLMREEGHERFNQLRLEMISKDPSVEVEQSLLESIDHDYEEACQNDGNWNGREGMEENNSERIDDETSVPEIGPLQAAFDELSFVQS